jgi:hypothetical protein
VDLFFLPKIMALVVAVVVAAVNRLVAGSNPARGAIIKFDH